MSHDQKAQNDKKQSCGNDGAVESLENQNQVFHSSHRPLEIAPRFPHSHSSGDDSYFCEDKAKPDGRGGFAPGLRATE